MGIGESEEEFLALAEVLLHIESSFRQTEPSALTFPLPVSQCPNKPLILLTSCLLQRWTWPPGGICVLASHDEKLGRLHPHQRGKSHAGLPHL